MAELNAPPPQPQIIRRGQTVRKNVRLTQERFVACRMQLTPLRANRPRIPHASFHAWCKRSNICPIQLVKTRRFTSPRRRGALEGLWSYDLHGWRKYPPPPALTMQSFRWQRGQTETGGKQQTHHQAVNTRASTLEWIARRYSSLPKRIYGCLQRIYGVLRRVYGLLQRIYCTSSLWRYRAAGTVNAWFLTKEAWWRCWAL